MFARLVILSVQIILIPLLTSLSYYTYNYINYVSNDFHYHQPFNSRDIARLSKDKVILITGANAGLGKATAKLLAQAGEASEIHYLSMRMRHGDLDQRINVRTLHMILI